MTIKKNFEITTAFTTKGFNEETEELVIEGIANAAEKDREGDIITEDAWRGDALKGYSTNPIILAFHDHTRPVGKATAYGVDSKGLHITATISKAAGDVYNLIKEGILKTFSVGFRVIDADYDSATDIFVIKELELYEISVVSVPANAGSTFDIKKSLSKEELNEFKKEFNIKEAPISAIEPETKLKEEEAHMPENNKDNSIEALEKKLADMGSGLELLLEAQAKADSERESKAKAKAEADVKAKAEAAAKAKEVEAAKLKASITDVSDGTARLIEELEKKLADQENSIGDVIKGFETDLKEKSDEILNMQKSRMTFTDTNSGVTGNTVPKDIMDTAVLLAKATGKPVSETKYFKDLVEKAAYDLPNPGEHLASMDEDWETEFSTRIYDDMRDRLVIEPLFNTIQMNTASMHLPINPEAGVGEWISRADFETPAARAGSVLNGSTGLAQKHLVTDITLVAHKLAAKEYLGYEEEEDSILPIMSIVRDAVIRRMSRSSDQALLVGDVGVNPAESGTTDVYPFNGLATLAVDASDTYVSGGGAVYASRAPVTVKDLAKTRQALGNWGLSPSDVLYIVSPDTYYELLEDADFRTMDLVGNKATIMTGQIGMVNGSPVLVSDSFATAAADGVAAVAVNTSNFYVGVLRGLMTERDKDIIAQQNVLVSTRRFTFAQIIASNAVAATLYPSAT